MQLKFKKICLLCTVIVYFVSFFFQSNLVFFQAWAQDINAPRVNIVLVLVDNEIYSGISDNLEWYATDYIQKKLSDTKALVVPLDLTNIHSDDIYRMMENVYFDGLKDVNSSLIGLILIGDIPLPVVNQNGYIFPTIFPYVDFENQKYVWDAQSEYFVSNGNSMGQAEIWHGLINYGKDIKSYVKFFEKIKKYDDDPNRFIGDSMWYEDFISQKNGFLNENFPYYRNRIMFAEDLGYQRFSPLMKKIFKGDMNQNAVDIVSELEKATTLNFGGKDVLLDLGSQGDDTRSTKMVQQEIQTSLVSDYNDLFSTANMSTMRENIFAGGRWIKEYENGSGEKSMVMDVDTSASKMQLKDDLLLGNENLQGLIENVNDLLESYVDRKINEKNLSMDIVVPIEYDEITKKRINFKCTRLLKRYDTYYFGSNARFIDKAEDLSIYRGTYRNLLDIDGLTYASLSEGKNPSKSDIDKTNLSLKSIGGSYDVFSNQAEGNRGYMMFNVEPDLDVYDENKTQKDAEKSYRSIFGKLRKREWPKSCSDDDEDHQCEGLFDFVKRWWGGASPVNLVVDNVNGGRYGLKDYLATDSWRPIFSMGGFQSLPLGEDEGSSGVGWKDGKGVGPQWDATSFKAYKKYASPTQREGWDKVSWAIIGKGYEIYENHTPDIHIDISEMEYWNLDEDYLNNGLNKESPKIFNVSKKKSSSVLKCGGTKSYTYKLINSIVKHSSTTEDQINGIDRDKYGENGKLSMYYHDIKTEFENLQADMSDILNTFPDLVVAINSGNSYIEGKIADLYSGGEALAQIKNDISSKQSQLSNLQDKLQEIQTLLDEKKAEKEAEESSEDADESNSDESADDGNQSDEPSIDEIIENYESQIDEIKNDMGEVQGKINSLSNEKDNMEDTIKTILNEVSNYISIENSKLTDIYKLVRGLYVENIIGVMEFIIYLEGGNLNDYYGGDSSKLVKIGFLSSWISDIKNIDSQIKNGRNAIVVNYEKVYSLLEQQQKSWHDLAVKLKEYSDKNVDDINNVTAKMDNIFYVVDDGKGYDENGNEIGGDEDGGDSITLTRGAARASMEEFDADMTRVNSLFMNLVEQDKVGPQIVVAAKSDEDFNKRVKSHSVRLVSDDDWINEYAQWAKGPGYDSEGAIKNHDLLLGASEHISGMNILTPDRPIDSPRYVSMQSVAGNEMKFIYPDLFKVEVYVISGHDVDNRDIHILLTGGQIKQNLIKYLNGKVTEYNTIVRRECDNALVITGDIYFEKLYQGGFVSATPDKNVHGCGDPFKYEDFLEVIGGEKMLDTISEALYYQSLTNKIKSGDGDIKQDIELIKKSFSINDKREKILSDYLVEGHEKTKNLVFEIPSYDKLGYEVAFINSDGRDYIFPSLDADSSEFSQTLLEGSASKYNIDRVQPTKQGEDNDKECAIPSNGRLPLFDSSGSPRVKGFLCWLEQTKKEPVKIKLTFDNSLGEILSAKSLKDYIKNSEIGQTFIDWGESWSRYEDSWDSLLNNGSIYDADKEITQMQVDAENHNQEAISGSDGLSNVLLNIYKELKVSNTNFLLSESNPDSVLRIESAVDLKNVTVEFTSTGDGCLKIDSSVLCEGEKLVKKFNPKETPFSGVVKSAYNVAGKTALIVKISVGGGFIEKILKYTVSPGKLDHVSIDGKNTMVAGMISPILVTGYDSYGNVVDRGLENYDFVVDSGSFLKDGVYQSGFTTNDFRNHVFYYRAPLDFVNGGKSTIQVKSSLDGKVVGTFNQNIVQANPVIRINGGVVLSGKNLVGNTGYYLSENESIYILSKLNINKLQKLEIDMKKLDGKNVDLDSQVLVTSQNGLVVVGQVNKDGSGNDVFFETSKCYISGGHVLLYFYPTTVAGDDLINIDIPGLDTRVIRYSISESVTRNVQLDIVDEYVKLGDVTDFEIYTSDIWKNPTSEMIYLVYDPNKVEFPNLVTVRKEKNVAVDRASVINGYLKTSIFGKGAGLTDVSVLGYSADIEFKVDKHIIPESGLNVMYLNYFGNDRGNQWGYFSDNNKHVELLMDKSNKIITTTTQLVSQKKVKKLLWRIEQGFKITNSQNIDTLMIMKGSKMDVKIGGMSELRSSLPNLKWETRSINAVHALLNKGIPSDSYVFFLPAESEYSVKDGILYSSGNRIASIVDGEVTLKLSTDSLDNGDNIWDVVDRGINYGKLITHFPGYVPKISDFTNPGDRYLVSKVFGRGSTDSMTSVGLFDGLSDFELDTSYKSIQNSDEIDERVGFLGDFKNITLFGEGEIVGEATRKFGSEFVINLGDPVLSRKNINDFVYGTKYDGGIGQEVYVDSENSIFGAYQIDFNKDGFKDWLIAYLDGSLKLVKNYGSTPDLRNMQELMRVAVHIDNIFIGDADGNGYEDILVQTDNNQIRAYLNNGGVFDADGSVVCLNQNVFDGQVSMTPSDLSGLKQFFVEDMDLDKNVDIVTFDEKGYIKVFYGGSTKLGPNYLSTQKYSCDTGWYVREKSKTTLVDTLGVSISSEDIFDNSMLHWINMQKEEISISESELSDYGINFNPNSLSKLIKEKERNSDGSIEDVTEEIMDKDKFDVQQASRKFISEDAKFVDVTLYENTLENSGHNYVFSPSSYLDPENPDDIGSVRKNYRIKSGSTSVLMDGDIVTVRVTIKASDLYPFEGSYGDIIQGPWNVYYDEKNVIKGIRPVSNWGKSVIKKKDGNFSYIIDNIKLAPGQRMVFDYDLKYHYIPVQKMSIAYKTFWSDDIYPDIKLQDPDGCVKNFYGYINQQNRLFKNEEILLQNIIDDEYVDEDSITEDYAADVVSYGSDVNKLPGIVGDTINRDKLLKSMSNLNLGVDESSFEKQVNAIDDAIDELTKGMCNGFSFGGSNNCKGLPVPFNQAFLAPGKYHLFGCWNLPLGPLEGGIPVFFFPGTLPTPFGPVPIPRGLKGGGDGFLWVPGGSYPSLIRIYAAPTLTAQLGIAVCMGKYMDEHIFPSPLADVAGNCVVFAVKPQCNNDVKVDERKKDKENPNQIYSGLVEEVRDSGICFESQKGPQVILKGYRSAPYQLASYHRSYAGVKIREDLIIPEDKMEDILGKIQSITNDNINAKSLWENALKGRVKIAGKQINFSLLDTIFGKETIDKLYNKYFSGANLVALEKQGYIIYPEFSSSVFGILELETASYVGVDDDIHSENNSIFIGDIDVLGGDFDVNKIKGGIQQGLRKLLIDNWLDPQIRYILNQLTKMHVNIRLPDISNLIGSEIGTIQNVSKNMGGFTEVDTGFASKLGAWAYVNYDNLDRLNNSIANPFESLASLLNQTNLVNISMEPITVKVPMIFAEDINAYELYLHQWLDVNSQIVGDWKSAMSSKDFIEFENGDWKKLQNQIYANLQILQEYRNFPFEIYEWIHVVDRYMSEIASLINSTIGYLAYRTTTNSARFVGYVDAIVLMLNIIKTYQVLIDFSNEWSEKCGTCTRDTYDQYSCKLSLLCNGIKLPIIQIPNFKLPNITIDLTNIDLGLDIVLPEFNFQPVRVNLPDLPNLPEPPSIGVNIKLFDLPDIPILPEPPELPELPSFIPEIDIELPILPPAPELPKLPNEIESVLKISELIGKIYCIVKGKFGLVGESSVKAKIEQLTQRTYEVKWIDSIMDFTNWSLAPVHNYGLDYEISSYVDFQFNFADFYNYLDTLTKSINNLTTSAVYKLNDSMDGLVSDDPLGINSLDGASVNLELDLTMSDINDIDIEGLESNEIEYVDYIDAKNRLQEFLTYFKYETQDTTAGDSVNSYVSKIENQINKVNTVESNIEGLEKVKNDVIDYLNVEKLEYSKLADLIYNDYDGFLAMVDSQDVRVGSRGNTGLLTFNTQLFDVDSSTMDTIKTITKNNPLDALLDNKKMIVDGYWNAINASSADDLGLTQRQYLVLRNSISSMKNQIAMLYSVVKPDSSTKLVAKDSSDSVDKLLLSASSTARLGSNIVVANAIDPSILSEGIYEKILKGADSGKLTKVIYSDLFVSSIGKQHYKTSQLENHDIVLWKNDSVYLKCREQVCAASGGGDKRYYHSKVLSDIPYQEKWISFGSSDTELKIADKNKEVKKWRVIGQTYDVLSFSRQIEDVDAYLIKLVDRIDYSYEKSDYKSVPSYYILALPEGTNIESLYSKNIKLELLKKIDKIENLYGKEVVQIVYYDNHKDFADITLSNIDRKWYYARIATLDLVNDTYNIDSPRSNQIVAGKQIVGDDQEPEGDPELYRPSVNEVVSQGNNLEGYVGTRYQLRVMWKDNVALSYINLSKDGKLLDEKYTSEIEDFVSTPVLPIHTKEGKEIYDTVGVDQFGNRTEKKIIVNYSIPYITIIDVSKNSDGKTVAIMAELSQDIDQGNVSFQRRRGNVWKTMKTRGGIVDFQLKPGQFRIEGNPYSVGNEIAMYSSSGDIMALMDPNTAEIRLLTGYKDSLDVKVKVQNGAVLQLCDKNTQNSIFSIYLPMQECKNIQADGYTIVDLPEKGKMGMFDGGKVIYSNEGDGVGSNMLFISPTCYLYSELGLEGTYSYDRERESIIFTLYRMSDFSKSKPIVISSKVQPFLNG